MLGMLVTSLIFFVLGLLGLLMAAGAVDASTQFMGIGLIVFAWFFMVAYHGQRAEKLAQAQSGH
ncbi:MAG: hypothetical protein P8Q36_07905 [Alphaproteobacteria bacterium]|jgi:hypothetical protein|nr:hypothetical protein [Rhodospirillaceae bacterium]MBT6509615.1 hypothetical protein [Rhodospirillaceae bacterium]MBT7646621.1 hypothetical protein [Rhodospirillaceae bacterium]MDG2480778.1 hypothetical protein [Alphaproteobacteria bacterium]